jgi:hypothetical protein
LYVSGVPYYYAQVDMTASYETAYRKACDRLGRSNLEEICRRSGAALNGRTVRITFFGQRVELRVPEPKAAGRPGSGLQPASKPPVEFSPSGLPLVEKILILHYLIGRETAPANDSAAKSAAARNGAAQDRTAQDRLVAFKNLPGASFYDPTYQKRGPRRIARRFGAEAEAFRRAGARLGWQDGELGDISFRFDIFPKIRGTVVLNLEDEEFPAEASILFSSEIVAFLSLEDVAVLAGSIATRLARAV